MKEIIMFKCDHCNKKYASKNRTRDHEKECWKNPEVKACNTCEYNSYDNGRHCVFLSENHQFPETYPQHPVMHCESWKSAYEYQEEEDE